EHSSEPASKSVDPFPIDVVERADAVDGQEEAAGSLDELSPPYMLKFNVPSADFEEMEELYEYRIDRYLLRVSIRGTRLGANFVPVATSDMILPEERDELLQADSNIDCVNTENTSSLSSQNIDPLGAHSKTEKHHSTTSTASGYSDKSSAAKNSTTAGSSLLTLYERDTDNTTKDLHNNSTSNGKDLKILEQQQKSSSQTPKKRDAPRTRPVTVHGPPSIPLVLHHNENPSKNSAISDKSHRLSENIPSLPKFSSPPPSIPLPPIPSHHESPIPPPPSVIQKRHKKSISSERIQNPMGIKQTRVENGNVISSTGNYGGVESGKLSVNQSLQPNHVTELPSDTASDTSYVDENVLDDTKKGRNGKRKALSLMVETFKGSAANSTHSVVSNSNVQVKDKRKTVSGTSVGSSNAAKRVMDWFRRKSLAKPEVPVLDVPSKLAKVEESVMTTNAPQSKSKAKRPKNNPSVIVTQPSSSTISQTLSRQSSTVDLNSAYTMALRLNARVNSKLANGTLTLPHEDDGSDVNTGKLTRPIRPIKYRTGRFTPEEDQMLVDLYNQHVESHKHNIFAVIESLMHRNSESLRERFFNHLASDTDRSELNDKKKKFFLDSATPGHSSPIASPKSQRLAIPSPTTPRS
ncbi:13820_t:CDS:2, partial [Acaulospora morrowiae]